MFKFQPKSVISFCVLLISVVIPIFLVIFPQGDYPIVQTANGKVQGFISTSRNGRRYSEFLGIPFAKPPVGALRFEPPQPPESWNGTLDATSYQTDCKGLDFIMTGRIQGKESCLFLNVMTPNDLSKEVVPARPKKLLPVIVYIYGGAFQMGTNKVAPAKYLMDENVILVTINYRLGIFGFLNTGDNLVRGNMGLKDQVMALKWIQKNIAGFGGDPNQVTILGSSAGGGSVHFLMLSPLAKGLFHRAMTASCEALSDMWQMNRSHVEHTGYMARHFGCPVTSTEEFVNCLRSVDEDELALYHSSLITPKLFHNFGALGPSIELKSDDAFLSEDPAILLREGRIASKVPWLVGVSENEGHIILGKIMQFIDVADIVQNEDNWKDLLPHLIFYDPVLRPEVSDLVKKKYFAKDLTLTENHQIINRLTDIATEKMFMKPLMESVEHQSKVSPVYLYYFRYKASLSVFNVVRWSAPQSFLPQEFWFAWYYLKEKVFDKHIRWWKPYHQYGASHGDETFLLFNTPTTESMLSVEDTKMSKILVKTVADFAAGKPLAYRNTPWPVVTPWKPIPVMTLNLDDPPSLLLDPFKTRLEFWRKLNLPRL